MYAFMIASCYLCKKLISFNPHKVPSIIPPEGGEKEPLCAECVADIQLRQQVMGVPVWADPHPDAYEPIAEEEL